MPNVAVVNENGDIETQRVISRDATVVPEGQSNFEPTVVQSVEYDHKGQTSSISSVCGETENRRETDEQPDITVEGIISEEELPDIKSIKEGDQITLISDVHKGDVFVRRVTISQTADLVHIVPDDTNKEELAFNFQLQLGQPGTGTE